MCPDAPRPNAQATEPVLREIDVLVEELASLSKGSLAPPEFYGEFLRRILSGLAAAGGVLWVRDTAGGLRVGSQLHLAESSRMIAPAAIRWHEQCAARALEAGAGIALPPGHTPSGDAADANPTAWLLLFGPWDVDGHAAGVVEVFQRPGASPSLERGYLRFLEVAGELLADYERNSQLRELRRRSDQWGRMEEFSLRIHGHLDLLAAAYVAANETRRLLACDRVSVLVRRGSACQVVAISGVPTVNRRSTSVRLVERLTAAALKVGEALWHPQAEHPPQIAEALDAYIDAGHARGLAILPLRVGDSPGPAPLAGHDGALVIECFQAPIEEPVRKTALSLGPHVALAIHNALEWERLPLGRFLRRLRGGGALGPGRRLVAGGLIGLAAAALLAVLVGVPADFTVEARGELQPTERREIFAPSDGVVRELRIKHGARVAANQVLLVLRRPELDLEFKRVGGELQTARKQLAAVETEQLQNRREDEAQRRRVTELTAQQEELRELLASLEAQYAILLRQQAELEVRSPLAGEVLTWNAEQLLAARPVARGQALLTVANLAGPWTLELRIPDRRASPVLQAQRTSDEPLQVSYTLATNPRRVRQGQLTRVGLRTEITETQDVVVLGTVRIDPAEVPERVPGAGVVAKVHCGPRAIGYVWLHDLIDTLWSWLFF
jgi:multidrug efflux pump subunit AcrA (membrane-fusion protein)